MTTFTYISLRSTTPSHRQLPRILVLLCLLLALVLPIPAAWAQSSDGQRLVAAVDAIGMTVADMDRAVEFYAKVLAFEKLSDVEVAGTEYEYLQGVFGLRMRVVRMRLGDEAIELTEYLAPRGRHCGRPERCSYLRGRLGFRTMPSASAKGSWSAIRTDT